MNAAYFVTTFGMQPHPEGGFFAETYRSTEVMPQHALPTRFSGNRVFSTAIYFLLESHNRSALHRIQSDEVWHFYAGGPLEVFVIDPDSGALTIIRLGNRPEQGHVFQAVVQAGSWFESKPMAGSDFSLVDCTVVPGFDFADFELADRAVIQQQFPQHEAIISLLCD